MKKVITAFANPKLKEELARSTKYEIVAPDIQYQEGIIELLEKDNQIDILILNSMLPGILDIKTLINNIKQINPTITIIIILENKDEEIENFLISKGIFQIYYNNQITINELINLLENNLNDNKINEEIKILKEIILENNKINKNKKINYKINNKIKYILNLFKKIKIKLINKNKIKNNKINNIISVVGASGTRQNYVLQHSSKFNKK